MADGNLCRPDDGRSRRSLRRRPVNGRACCGRTDRKSTDMSVCATQGIFPAGHKVHSLFSCQRAVDDPGQQGPGTFRWSWLPLFRRDDDPSGSPEKLSYSHASTQVKSTQLCRLAQAHEWIEVGGENFRPRDANFGGFVPEMGIVKSPLESIVPSGTRVCFCAYPGTSLRPPPAGRLRAGLMTIAPTAL